MPQTTVLIPTYNCGKYLADTINSVLHQPYTDYEMLIIDDGSTDNTEHVIKSIKDQRIVYLKNNKNLGIVKTLNKGIKLAKGKYIARMDADDLMLGNRLQLQVDFLEQNPDYGMVGGWYQVMDENGQFKKSIPLPTDSELLKIGLLFSNQFAHPAVTMRSTLLRDLKYKQDFIYCEDFDLWTRFAEISNIANLPYYFLSYRWYANNSCHRKQSELRNAFALLFSRELEKLKIEHDAEELMMQVAVNFNLASKLFVNETKQKRLMDWHDKIFNSSKLQRKFSIELLQKFRQKYLPMYMKQNN